MSDPAPSVAIDANVILRYLLDDHRVLSRKAARVLEGVESGSARVHCDPVTLAEVVWVLSSFYAQANRTIAEALEPILKADGFEMADKDRYVLALELFGGTLKHFGDACACAAAITECGGRLCSFDRKLSKTPGVERVETP